MARLIATYDGRDRAGLPIAVKVRWYADTQEYVCEATINGKRRDAADYFTSDKLDALGTARDMCGHEPAPEGSTP